MRIKLNILTVIAVITMLLQPDILAQKQKALPPAPEKTLPTVVPVIVNGEAQKIPAFENSDEWIKHDLWVEAEFDTDGDGKKDRMHVDVTRPRQTETEGLRLPVIYESSPYFAGTGSTASQYFWNVRQELNTNSPKRNNVPPIERRGQRPVISTSQTRTWIPYGFIVVHSSAPGTRLSQGCPTI
jgi:X-Pro dipeptidyl-peptidase